MGPSKWFSETKDEEQFQFPFSGVSNYRLLCHGTRIKTWKWKILSKRKSVDRNRNFARQIWTRKSRRVMETFDECNQEFYLAFHKCVLKMKTISFKNFWHKINQWFGCVKTLDIRGIDLGSIGQTGLYVCAADNFPIRP